MKKTLTLLQVLGGIGVAGTVGEMERNVHMTIGEGIGQMALFFAGIVILQLIKSNCPKQKANSAPGNHTHFYFSKDFHYSTEKKICQGVIW